MQADILVNDEIKLGWMISCSVKDFKPHKDKFCARVYQVLFSISVAVNLSSSEGMILDFGISVIGTKDALWPR